jgi:hypothetical protein
MHDAGNPDIVVLDSIHDAIRAVNDLTTGWIANFRYYPARERKFL